MIAPVFLQLKYAKLFAASHIPLFEVKRNTPFVGLGRCPFCGDSKKSEIKKRFYVLEKKGNVVCYCQNCGFSSKLEWLIKDQNPFLWREYLTEKFVSAPQEIKKEESKQICIKQNDSWRDVLIPIQFSKSATEYLESRRVPKKQWNRLFYTKNLKETYSDICFSIGVEEDPTKKIPEIKGIFMPFLDINGNILFSNTRNIESGIRYATVEFQESPKIFGVETIDQSKDIVVFEGPIDSLFVENSVATGDASLDRAELLFPKEKLILFPDNEKRATIQTRRIKKFVNSGYRIVLLPDYLKQKDANDIVLAGWDLESLIKENTFSGLSAKLKYKDWVKC